MSTTNQQTQLCVCLCSCVRVETNSPGVKLVNDALEAYDSEEPGAEAGQPGQEQDGERQQRLPPGRLRQAAGQTSTTSSSSSRCCRRRCGSGVAASLRDRRAAAPVPGVRRSGVQRGFVFAVGNRVMLRHILRQSRASKQARKKRKKAKRAIWYYTGKKSTPLFLPSLCHAPLPKPLAPPSLRAPHTPQDTRGDSKLYNLASHRPQKKKQPNDPRESHSNAVLQQHTGSDTRGSSSSSFLPWSWMKEEGGERGAGSARGAGRAVSLSRRDRYGREGRGSGRSPIPRRGTVDRRAPRPVTSEPHERRGCSSARATRETGGDGQREGRMAREQRRSTGACTSQ